MVKYTIIYYYLITISELSINIVHINNICIFIDFKYVN